MKFTDITGNNLSGSVKGLTIDIPKWNASDGTPELKPSVDGITKIEAYGQKLKGRVTENVLSLRGNVIGAGIYISFLPKGRMGDIVDGNSSEDKITAVGTQNSATYVQASKVYYKVD